MSKMITFAPTERLDVPWKTFTATTKPSAETMLHTKTNGASWCTGGGNNNRYSGLVKSGFIYMLHFQKFRRKACRLARRKPKIFNNEMVFNNQYTGVYAGHWEVKIYRFPLDRVISAQQKTRNFTVVLKG